MSDFMKSRHFLSRYQQVMSDPCGLLDWLMRKIGSTNLVVFVRSVAFYVLSGALFLVLWPLTFVSPKVTDAISRAFLIGQTSILNLICGIRVVVEGRENLPDHSVLIASQHESTWETLYFHLLFDQPVMYAKKEIFDYPFFGRLTRKFGHIPVDRTRTSDAVREGFRRGADVLKSGRNLLVFPTGTRQGEKASHLQSGIGVLYQLAGTSLLPVLLDSGICWPAGGFLKYPGRITVRILPAIPAGLPRRELMQILETKLLSEGPPKES
ncbi:lysophospholipid acyltransferase family protein [Shimia sp.]|uniref:lysophospholipid acyltransferase family protein n=1 Tax=Shimia sp. TaxID=1954381 RepID=UPI0032974EEA